MRFDLGESVERPLSLHVILRTTDAVMNMNSSRNLEEIGIVTKRDVIEKGGCSLFGAAKRFVEKFGRDRLRITLVLDRMSEEGLSLITNVGCALSFAVMLAILVSCDLLRDRPDGPAKGLLIAGAAWAAGVPIAAHVLCRARADALALSSHPPPPRRAVVILISKKGISCP